MKQWKIIRFISLIKLLRAPYSSSSFLTDRSKAVSLLQFFFVRRLFHIWRFVSSLYVPHLSFMKAVLRDCAISWVFSFIFSKAGLHLFVPLCLFCVITKCPKALSGPSEGCFICIYLYYLYAIPFVEQRNATS